MTPSSTPLESRGLPAQASSSAKPVSSDNASPSPSQALPRLMLDGLDLAGANAPTNTVETNEHQQEEDAPDDDKQRQRELERLRAQLERSELNRSPLSAHRTNGPSFAQDSQAPSPEHGTTETPENLKSSQRSRRRVQWVGLTADDEFRDHFKRTEIRPSTGEHYPQHRLGHTSVSIPSTPQDEIDEPSWPGMDGLSDGLRTPGSAFATPDASRPPSPEAVSHIPPGEKDGLPLSSTSTKRGRTFTREAAKLVAFHKAKMFKGKKKPTSHARGASGSSDVSPTRRGASTESAYINRSSIYNDQPATPSVNRPPSGGGVLSSLLRLYDQPQSEYSSSATLVPSRANTPPASSEGFPLVQGTSNHRAPAELPVPPSFASEVRRRSQIQLNSMLNGASHRVDTIRDWHERPSSSDKSKHGLASALQQSTAALAGAASPAASSITASAKRPGHNVDRYSMPEIPTLQSLAAQGSDSEAVPKANSPSDPKFLSQPNSRQTSPERPLNVRRKTGSTLALNQLVKVPEQIARGSEKLARESLDPKKYYRESAVLRAAKSREGSPSVPGTPKFELNEKQLNEKLNEKTPIKRRRKDKKRQEEIFITMHVAAILQRQDFILRFARALMMFGAPPHRIEYQLQQTAKVLQIECQVIYIVNFMIISFSDAETHTSEIKFIKQFGGLDLTKLTDIAILHWEVVHDKIGVEEASIEISNLMKAKPTYNNWQLVAFGSCASAMIGMAAFSASFIDLLVAMPLGALLVTTQCFIAARSDVLSSIFEIVIAAVISFVAAALASTQRFCYASITSMSIVLILPGWPTCLAALELQSRSLVSGSVRIVYAVVYSLFLGFGISLGANVWQLVSSQDVYTSNDNKCTGSHPADAPWYQQTIPPWFYFLAVPGFPLCLSLRNFAKPNKELLAMVLIAGCGWTANHFSTYGFPGRSDISSALGAFTVGILSNVYGKMFQSTAFIVAATPIMFQLPSGLGNGGLLNWATTDANDQVVFSSGWSVASQLIQVVIGLVVGLLFACAVIYPFGKRRGGLMTF